MMKALNFSFLTFSIYFQFFISNNSISNEANIFSVLLLAFNYFQNVSDAVTTFKTAKDNTPFNSIQLLSIISFFILIYDH